MIASESVRKIGFTGSTAVGKLLMAGAANTVKVCVVCGRGGVRSQLGPGGLELAFN